MKQDQGDDLPFEKRGLASFLIKQLFTFAQKFHESGYVQKAHIYLRCTSHNKNFYENLGFKICDWHLDTFRGAIDTDELQIELSREDFGSDGKNCKDDVFHFQLRLEPKMFCGSKIKLASNKQIYEAVNGRHKTTNARGTTPIDDVSSFDREIQNLQLHRHMSHSPALENFDFGADISEIVVLEWPVDHVPLEDLFPVL